MENPEERNEITTAPQTEQEKAWYEKKQTPEKQVGSRGFVIVITALLSICATFLLIYSVNDGIVFIKKTAYGDLTKVIPVCETINAIDEEYYPTEEEMPTDEEMVNIAMKAIVYSLGDPYAEYFTKEEYEAYQKEVNGSYDGYGIVINPPDEKGANIESVYQGSPAETAGIKAGDIITAVNGTVVANMDIEALSKLMQENDTVTLDLLRDTQKLTVTCTRGKITVKEIKHEMLENKTGYIRIVQFTDEASGQFRKALEDLTKQGMTSLIIDVRSNPGGYLDSVVGIVDQILDEGTIVTVGNATDDPTRDVYKATKGGIDVPIAVLVNEGSASASEIFAAALQENGKATIVGTTTYGKGIVQSTGRMYSNDGYLKITTDAYFTPKGNNIHKKGVTPDVEIHLPPIAGSYTMDTLPRNMDKQLDKALEVIKQGAGDN